MAKYELGLALSGGSIKGFAHLGVLKYLEERGLRPELMAGTSAGSIMGAFYAAGYTPEEIYELFSKVGFLQVTRPSFTGSGLFRTTHFHRLLKRNLPVRRLEQLPLPMRIVATDLERGEQVVFTEGLLADIILASCSIPILFTPTVIGGRSYVDGGLFRNFPVTVIREDCRQVIGVNLGPMTELSGEQSLLSIANRTWELIFRQNTTPDREACDYLIESTEMLGYGSFDLSAAPTLMSLGYDLAKATLATLQPSTKE